MGEPRCEPIDMIELRRSSAVVTRRGDNVRIISVRCSSDEEACDVSNPALTKRCFITELWLPIVPSDSAP
jgi:hypothetical protein